MRGLLTEEKVLKKLGISDFRALPREKVFTMASMLSQMEPEVAQKAIEQFPQFSETMKSMLNDYKAFLDKALEANDKSIMSCYNSCDTIIRTLQQELERENLSFEEKKYIIEQMIEVNNVKAAKDSENKRFLATMSAAGLFAIGGIAVLGASLLGAKAEARLPDNKNENRE